MVPPHRQPTDRRRCHPRTRCRLETARDKVLAFHFASCASWQSSPLVVVAAPLERYAFKPPPGSQLTRSASKIGTETDVIYQWLQTLQPGSQVYINIPHKAIAGGSLDDAVSVACGTVQESPACCDNGETAAPDFEQMNADRELFALITNVHFLGGATFAMLDYQEIPFTGGFFCARKSKKKFDELETWTEVGNVCSLLFFFIPIYDIFNPTMMCLTMMCTTQVNAQANTKGVCVWYSALSMDQQNGVALKSLMVTCNELDRVSLTV